MRARHNIVKIDQQGFGIIGLLTIMGAIAVLGLGSWYIWQIQTAKLKGDQTKTDGVQVSTPTKTSSESLFQIPELGIEFETRDNIKPVYTIKPKSSVSGANFNSLVGMSTQQLIDEGQSQSSEGANPCALDKYRIVNLYMYNSPLDALTAYNNGVGVDVTSIPPDNNGIHEIRLVETDLVAKNGFFAVKDKIFYIPQEFQVQASCLDIPYGGTDLVRSQWELLRNSLMTLRAIQ